MNLYGPYCTGAKRKKQARGFWCARSGEEDLGRIWCSTHKGIPFLSFHDLTSTIAFSDPAETVLGGCRRQHEPGFSIALSLNLRSLLP